jgi:hypothetical protein
VTYGIGIVILYSQVRHTTLSFSWQTLVESTFKLNHIALRQGVLLAFVYRVRRTVDYAFCLIYIYLCRHIEPLTDLLSFRYGSILYFSLHNICISTYLVWENLLHM